MIHYDWNDEKNLLLKVERGIGFEEIVLRIDGGFLLDILDHPNREKYGHQKVLVVEVDGYAYAVPYVEDGETWFLKTIIPSRKLTREYRKERK